MSTHRNRSGVAPTVASRSGGMSRDILSKAPSELSAILAAGTLVAPAAVSVLDEWRSASTAADCVMCCSAAYSAEGAEAIDTRGMALLRASHSVAAAVYALSGALGAGMTASDASTAVPAHGAGDCAVVAGEADLLVRIGACRGTAALLACLCELVVLKG